MLPTSSELVNNAMYLYGPPIDVDDLSGDDIQLTQLRLYPCLNFTCSGRIVKLMFVAPVETSSTVTVRWPEFGLWRKCNLSQHETCTWIKAQTLSTRQLQPSLVYMNESRTVGVYEIEFTSSSTFESGHFLGVRHRTSGFSDRALNVLHQHGGGYCDALTPLLSSRWQEMIFNLSIRSRNSILPYVAIETGKMFVQINSHFLKERQDLVIKSL